MLFGKKGRGPKELPARDIRTVSFSDEAVSTHPLTTYVERPDQYTTQEHAASAAAIDCHRDSREVLEMVQRALTARALDEYTADIADARIDELLKRWNEAVDAESARRTSTLLQLRAMETHDLTTVADDLTRLRGESEEDAASLAGWRAVLRGASTYQPWTREDTATPQERAIRLTAPAAPNSLDLEAAIHASRSLMRPDPTTSAPAERSTGTGHSAGSSASTQELEQLLAQIPNQRDPIIDLEKETLR